MKNRLLALVALCGATSSTLPLWAADWADPELTFVKPDLDGIKGGQRLVYYVYHVASEKFMSNGADFNTTFIVSNTGQEVTLSYGPDYELITHPQDANDYSAAKSYRLSLMNAPSNGGFHEVFLDPGIKCYVDHSKQGHILWDIVPQDNGLYRIRVNVDDPLYGTNKTNNAAYKNKQIDNVEISNEGRRALREKLREVKPKVEEPIGYELTIQDTNEVEWEHYISMREYSGLTLKDGKYNLEDVMKSMMDAYETRYNYIVKEHENGERQVSYDLTGENSLTLDEDLAGLDRAYNKRLANLAGYIVCQQTNDGSKFFQTTNVKKNTAEQKEYIDTAVSMMEKAQKRFLEMREEPKYTAGIAKSVIWDIMSNDNNFMETTQRLFAKTIYHNA